MLFLLCSAMRWHVRYIHRYIQANNFVQRDELVKYNSTVFRKTKKAAHDLDDALFVEYWGENVPPNKRIGRWVEKRMDTQSLGHHRNHCFLTRMTTDKRHSARRWRGNSTGFTCSTCGGISGRAGSFPAGRAGRFSEAAAGRR